MKSTRTVVRIFILMLSSWVAVIGIGAMPKQESVPPQPFYADFYSGRVDVTDEWPETGVKLYACVLDCSRFRTEMVDVNVKSGWYEGLKIDPSDKRLLYQEVTFYLDNGLGSVKASDTSVMEGAFIRKIVDLTFDGPVPIEIIEEPMKEARDTIGVKSEERVKEIPVSEPTLPQVGGLYNIYFIGGVSTLGLGLILGGVFIMYRGRRYRLY